MKGDKIEACWPSFSGRKGDLSPPWPASFSDNSPLIKVQIVKLTQSILRNLLSYDPETGLFTRLVVTCNKVKIGDIAGSLHYSGYIHIRVLGVIQNAQRLAWLYMTGSFPNGEIDHINGNRSDNRLSNLRDVSKSVNLQNQRKAQSSNKAKLLGVDYRKNLKKWVAQIQINGVKHYLGTFSTPELAHAAYTKAKREIHEGCTI